MSDTNERELEISEFSYKQAVLAMKFLETTGNSSNEVNMLQKQAEGCLTSDSASRISFGLNLLRFLYKKGMISIGWFLKRRIRELLKADSSSSVRLAAFDLLGAILSKTGSKSGVRESDYSTILNYRESMLERSSKLRQYESSGVQDDVNLLDTSKSVQVTVDGIIANL